MNVPVDCRVDGIEKWLDWLPSEDEPAYSELFSPDRVFKIEKEMRRCSHMQVPIYIACLAKTGIRYGRR